MFKTSNLIAALAVAGVAALDPAAAADLPVKAKAAPPAELPLFIVNDNRLTFSYIFDGTDPGVPGKTAKQVYSFTHFDVWAYGTNFFTISMYKSDSRDPAVPCGNPTQPIFGCAGATEFYGLARSTLGWNEIFNTKMFSIGPLRNISFEAGADFNTENNFVAPAKRSTVAGLQFAFELPYKGFFNVAPMVYWEFSNHNSFTQCGLFGPGTPGVTCLANGNTRYNATWTIETNYYMDLGFLPPWLPLSISGRAAWIGTKGLENSPLPAPAGGTPTAIEFNSEPIRLTLDASKAFTGNDRYSHVVDLWVAYRYWQNKFGLDHAKSAVCTGPNAGSCTESSLYSGVSVKF